MPTTVERLREARPGHAIPHEELFLHGWTPEHETNARRIIKTGTVSQLELTTFRTTLLNEARTLYRTDEPEMIPEHTGQFHPVFIEADFIAYVKTVDEIIHMPDDMLKEKFIASETERLEQWKAIRKNHR